MRAAAAAVLTFTLLVGFQNCAPPVPTDKKTGSSDSAESEDLYSQNPWQSGHGAGGGSGGLAIGGGRGGGGSSSGSGSGGGNSVGGGVSIGGGGASGGGGSSGGSGGGGTIVGGGNDSSFRISRQPEDVNIFENANFNLEVQLTGGKSPYKYQWYKNGAAITGGLGAFPFYSDTANSYHKEGTYYVEVTDGSGQTLRSMNARVVILEPQEGCAQGSYFTYTNATYDTSYNYFTEYFDGPRGKYLLHRSYDTYNIIYSAGSYAGLSTYNTSAALPYKGKTWISCRTAIPRIHSPQYNPMSDYGTYDAGPYSYQGSVEFECRNKKLHLVQNTCRWVYTDPETGRQTVVSGSPVNGGGRSSK